MKITFRKLGLMLYISIQLRTNIAAPVYLCWRNGNHLQEVLLDLVDYTNGHTQFTLLVRPLSATHFIRIVTPKRIYNRFIPIKFLNLSSEHE